MERIATAFKMLALLVTVTGLVCLFLFWRPADLAAGWRVAQWLAVDVFANRWIFILAPAAFVLSLAARVLEGSDAPPRRDPGVHALDVSIASPQGPFPPAEPIEFVAEPEESNPGLGEHLRGEPNVPAFVDDLLRAAVEVEASDVHIQPLDTVTRVAWRVHGELADVVNVPREHHELVVRRLKILAQLTTFHSDLPQDGRFTLETSAGAVDVRVSVLSTRHGEKIVLRLARAGHGLIGLDRLGMPEPLLQELKSLLAQPQGLIVLTGPTGCGKTTTLYSSLAHIQETRGATVSISTIEDPIEIDVPFLSQTQVDHATGLSFGQTLRAVLRQDPNVVMIGEIRDSETAHTAVEAGLTGHLILTTLHADSTAGVFNRLIDMGVEPFVVSSAVLATVSQRLARSLCTECRQPATTDAEMIERMIRRGITQTAAESLSFYTASGCATCSHTGLGGQTAIFELLRVTPRLRDLITEKVTTPRIAQVAAEEGMTPLLRAALLEAVAGTISLEEALRLAG